MPIEKLKLSFSFTEERLRLLEELVPEAFADGRINWESLREALGEQLEDDEASTEHFGLFWPGKRHSRRSAGQPSKGTLAPVSGDGVDEDTTDNVFIEGDNLEVLKLLQKSYAGRIKMIYIDPPYNTGSDFIYKDDFAQPLEEYLKITGQMTTEGQVLTTNSRSDGRYHTNWLNMMYPRLRLAKNLLRKDGVIFVSIDDNEVHNLRQVMNEVLSEDNFLANIVWQKKYSPQNDAKFFSESHEHILCYANDKAEFQIGLLERTDEANARYKNPDKDPRGPWKASDLTRQEYRPRDDYEIVSPKTGKRFRAPKGNSWGRPEDTIKELISDNRIWFGPDGNSVPSLKRFLSEVKQGITPQTIWLRDDVGDTQEGKKQIKDIFGDVSVFETPKPTRLILRAMLIAGCKDDDVILDYFAGSASTAHAVFDYNREHSSQCRFIQVQLQEPTESSQFPTIAEVGKERIRRASKEIRNILSSRLKLNETKADLGFKVFRLTQSNFKAWRDYQDDNSQELESLFSAFETPLVDGWSERDVLTEILLIEGFPLHSRVGPAADFSSNKVLQVESDFSAHRLFVCLEAHINDKTIERLAVLPQEDIFICLDSALNDAGKVRLDDVGNVRTI